MHLPSEIIQCILKYLPQKDLLKCTHVCKRFNEIIKSNKMIKTLFIRENESSALPVFERKYSKVKICGNNPQNISSVLKSIGDDVLEVNFEYHSTTLETIVSALNYLPQVREVSFYYIRLDDDDEVIKNVVQPLPHTVNLSLIESNPKILLLLMNVKVEKMEMRIFGDTPYYDFTDVHPFMEKQNELKSFSMGGFFETNFMIGNIPRGDYHLTEFEASNCDLEEWSYLETFLNTHAIGSLEKLILKSLSSWDPSSVIKSCSKLKVLELEEMALDELDEEITSVEELSVDYPGMMFDKFPNLKKLTIKEAAVESNRLIHGSKIQELHVQFGTVEGIHCENVKKMSLKNIDVPLTEEFFRIHSKVENLKLENIFDINDALLESILRNLPALKTLRIYGLNKLTGRAFQLMSTHSKNLRFLDMTAWSQSYSINDWKCLFESNSGIEIYVEKFD